VKEEEGMYSLVLAADVDVSASIISICNWVIGLGLALGTTAFVGVGIMFIFAFDDIYQGARARKALVMIIFGMILLYSAAGIAGMVKDHMIYQQPVLMPK
jgi:hypothetical protein